MTELSFRSRVIFWVFWFCISLSTVFKFVHIFSFGVVRFPDPPYGVTFKSVGEPDYIWSRVFVIVALIFSFVFLWVGPLNISKYFYLQLSLRIFFLLIFSFKPCIDKYFHLELSLCICLELSLCICLEWSLCICWAKTALKTTLSA